MRARARRISGVPVVDGDKLVDHYRDILGRIEEIIQREDIITLPQREAGIRIASAAETARQPAPRSARVFAAPDRRFAVGACARHRF